MRIIHLFLLVGVLSVQTSAYAQGLDLFKKEEYRTSADSVLPYRVLYPENFDASKKYPLVLVLHGAGERGTDNEKQLTHGANLFLNSDVRAMYPSIVVFPQCPPNQYWSSVQIDRSKMPYPMDFNYERYPVKWPLQAAINLVQEFVARGVADSKRIYITGLSMGGMGTFEAVYRHPKLFAAAQPICGGGDVLHYDKRVKKIPFWVFHGDQDGVVAVQQSRDMVTRLKELRVKVTYTEYPGVNHNSWDKAFAEPAFLAWMFSQKR